MSNFEVTGVRTEETPADRHEHITAVQIADTAILSRSTVIADLLSATGDRYYTYAAGQYARVEVGTCPHCWSRNYITTAPDSTTANNLLHLKRV
jgi:hypothetical protein